VGGKVGRGLGHDNVTQLQQEGLAELHLQVSVKTEKVVWDVYDDDEGGVLCPRLAQSPDQLSTAEFSSSVGRMKHESNSPE
jgi:hypothetical protein